MATGVSDASQYYDLRKAEACPGTHIGVAAAFEVEASFLYRTIYLAGSMANRRISPDRSNTNI